MLLTSLMVLLASVSQYGDTFNDEGVYIPFTSLRHGEMGYLAVVWLYMPGYVGIELCKNYYAVATLAEWVPTDDTGYGSWVYQSAIPASWGSGSGYRLRLYDSYGNERWSDEFSITSNGSIYRTSDRWAQGMSNAGVQWSGFSGSVYLSLVDPNGSVTSLGSYTGGSGSATIGIQDWMGTGSGYKLKATDSYGNSAVSSPFSILAVNVTRPSPGETWSRGVVQPTIRWTGEGSEANLTLMKGSQVVSDLTGGWVPNTGEFMESLTIPETWAGGSDYTVRVRIRNSSGGTDEGSSSQFSIPYSDNQPEGARTLTPERGSEGAIDYAGDIDYWKVICEPLYTYSVSARCINGSQLQIERSGTTGSEYGANGEIEWDSSRGGTYYVKVSSSAAPGTTYSILSQMRQFPEILRKVRLTAGASLMQTDGLSGLGAGVDVGAFYSPVRYAELGASLYTISGDEAFSSIVDPDSTTTFVFSSFSAGVESPSLQRFSVRVGASYDIAISGPAHFWMKPEYEDLSGAYESGIRGYGSIDCKLAWNRYGSAFLLRLQRSFLSASDGRTTIGLVYAF
jgi:hypothetical protein